jgi:hypothetical protein
MEWMWKLRGELVVISIPFVKGKHFASNIEDFIPVVKALRRMHEAGYVHGDIRCFNIIFGKGLIDFDFGGQIDNDPKYPPGYQGALGDGVRLGREKQSITALHDWFALIHVIFALHCLKPPLGASVTLRDRRDRFTAEDYPMDHESIPADLENFLQDVKDTWTVSTSRELKAVLPKNHSVTDADRTVDQTRRLATDTATPSPPDNKKLIPN